MPAQVHRFHGRVALYVREAGIDEGATAYFTPVEARKIARALNAAARDCRDFPNFAYSKVGTFSLIQEG